jgi:hypothetical protein
VKTSNRVLLLHFKTKFLSVFLNKKKRPRKKSTIRFVAYGIEILAQIEYLREDQKTDKKTCRNELKNIFKKHTILQRVVK